MADEPMAIALAAVIEKLREELTAAVHAGKGEEVRFALGPIELDIQIALTKETGVDGGFRFSVLSLGGKRSRTAGETHSLHISLVPALASDLDPDKALIVGSQEVRQPD